MNLVTYQFSPLISNRSDVLEELIVLPDTIRKIVVVKEARLIFRVVAVMKLAIRSRHCSQLLNLSDTLFSVETREVNASELFALRVITKRSTIQLVIIVHLVVDTFCAHHCLILGVLALELFHLLEVRLVVNLEAARLYFILPDLIVQLNVVEDCIDQALDVGVFICQQLKNNLNHLRLVEYNLARRLEEEKLEECLQDLLHHLVILLFGTEQILQHLDEIRVCDLVCNELRATNGGNKHDALENDIILGKAVHQISVDKLEEVCFLDDFFPMVRRNINHSSKQLEHEIRVVAALLHKNGIVL